MEGLIGPGSAAKLARTVRGLGGKRLPILINSPGGLVSEAMQMGELIRKRSLDVAVTRTALVTCPADRDACGTMVRDGVVLGLPDSRRAVCASACTLVLAAGTQRLVASWAHVGVHQYVGFIRKTKVMQVFRVLTRVVNGVRVEVSRTLVSQKPVPDSAVTVRGQPHYEESAAYFSRMGIGKGIMPLLQSAPSTGIYWMTPEDLLATKLATDDAGGESLVMNGDAMPKAAAATPIPTGPPPPAVPSDASPNHEIAALVDDAGMRIRLTPGHVTWSVDRDPSQGGSPSEAALVAKVDLDNDSGSLTLRISKRADAAGNPASRLFVQLLRGSNSPFSQVLAVENPGLRKDAHALPDPFVGQVDGTSPATFSMVLSDTREDAARNLALLSADQWIDVPIMIDGARTVRVTFALGSSGASAFRRWLDLPIASGGKRGSRRQAGQPNTRFEAGTLHSQTAPYAVGHLAIAR